VSYTIGITYYLLIYCLIYFYLLIMLFGMLVVLWSSVIDWLVDLLDFIVILGILDFLFSCVGRGVLRFWEG